MELLQCAAGSARWVRIFGHGRPLKNGGFGDDES
jgi:hypothetical protein